MERPVASSAFGQGSSVLGALSSNALASKAAGSNIYRLGSKMAIPSAIDSSGLVDVASISRQATKTPAAVSGDCLQMHHCRQRMSINHSWVTLQLFSSEAAVSAFCMPCNGRIYC